MGSSLQEVKWRHPGGAAYAPGRAAIKAVLPERGREKDARKNDEAVLDRGMIDGASTSASMEGPMTTGRMKPVLQQLRQAVLRQDRGGMTDGQLLESFLASRDEAAFEGLLRRHGPMVLGVCRRILGNPHDAEDAFQATFLVLARKASSILPRDRVGCWLHGVAHTTAVRVRAANARRQGRERQVTDMPEPEVGAADGWDDLQPALDEELARLPEKYRTAILLCDLQGRTRREAARQLKVPEGTLSSRLTTGRRKLARRLMQRGIVLSGGSLAVALAQQVTAAVPASLVGPTVKAALLSAAGKTLASGLVSARAITLSEGVVKTMLLAKLRNSLLLVFVLSLLGLGSGMLGFRPRAEEPSGGSQPLADMPERPDVKRAKGQPRTDRERLQGSWRIVSTSEGGKVLKEGDERLGDWTFKDTTVRIRSQPRSRKEGTTTEFFRFRVDETTTPRRLDLVEWDSDFDDPDAVGWAIYSFEGDTLKICYSCPAGADRPTEFRTRKGADMVLVVLKKEAPRKERRSRDASRKAADKNPAPAADTRTDKVPRMYSKQAEEGDKEPIRLNSSLAQVNSRDFRLPFDFDLRSRADMKKVYLYYSTDQGQTYQYLQSADPDKKAIEVHLPEDGLYWFVLQLRRKDDTLVPVNPCDVRPHLKLQVRTKASPRN
jgi:RNA polymerase sigma-70 factor (ECF subfamily)